MPDSLGDAYVQIHANTAGFEKDMEKGVTKSTKAATKEMGSLEKATDKVGGAAKKLFGAYLGFQGAKKIVDFAQDSIRAYSDLNESLNAVTVSFGENADEVLALGKAAAENLGLSNAEFNALSVSVSAFTEKIAVGLGQEVPATLDTLTTRIADFASVMNLDVAEGFEKFRSGLAGESEPLRQFGIDVSAATVKQVALANGIIGVGEEMTEGQKVTARYLAIMEQTEKVAGDFANTSGDLANAQRIQNAELEDAKAVLGESLLPLQTTWLEIQKDAIPVLGDLANAVGIWTGALDRADVALRAATSGADDNAQALDIAKDAINELHFAQTVVGNAIRNSFIPDFLAAKTTGEEFSESVLGVVLGLELTDEELQKMIDNLPALADELSLNQEKSDALEEALRLRLTNAVNESADAVQIAKGGLGELEAATVDLTGETEDLTEKVQTNAEVLQDRQDQIRANLDPIFALSEATRDQAAAEQAVNDAMADATTTSEELIPLLENLAESNLDLREAQDNVRVSTNLSKQAFIEQQIELGLTREQANLLAERFAFLEAFKFTDKTIRISEIYGNSVSGRASGGPVEADTPYWVGENRRPELFVPKVSGTILTEQQVGQGGGGLSVGSITVTLSGSGNSQADAMMVADAIEERLVSLSRARVVR